MKKVLLVGRHAPTGLDEAGFIVMEQKSVTFSADPFEALEQLERLNQEAARRGFDGVLLQNTPGALGAGFLAELLGGSFGSAQASLGLDDAHGVGVVIARPGPRPAGVSRRFEFRNGDDAEQAAVLVEVANPRAKVLTNGKCVVITVDPPMRFELEHVVWVGGDGEVTLYSPQNPA